MDRRELLKSLVVLPLFGKSLIAGITEPDLRLGLLKVDPRDCLGYLINDKGHIYQPSPVIHSEFFEAKWYKGFILNFNHPIHVDDTIVAISLRHPKWKGAHRFPLIERRVTEGDTLKTAVSISYTFNEYLTEV